LLKIRGVKLEKNHKKAWAASVGGYIFSHNSQFTTQAKGMT
jgi:hypothetical protein